MQIQLENGEKLPFIVDTGMPITAFPKSLGSQLGKCLDTTTIWNFGTEHEANIYKAPKLYLGNTQLRTGERVITYDYTEASAPLPENKSHGIIGMDVLRHYCIQLDFQNGKMRFLDNATENKGDWGKPFPLSDIGDGCFFISENLTGTEIPGTLIDTGYKSDGWLVSKSFQQWTNQQAPLLIGEVRKPNGILGQQPYQEIDLSTLSEGINPNDFHTKFNGIGLGLLARNLVTLDFPNRMLYLKRTSQWRLAPLKLEELARSTSLEAVEHLKSLKERGQLPGWSKTDDGSFTAYHFKDQTLNTVTFDTLKIGATSIYHYTLVRDSKDGVWKLHRAWRTDPNGRELEQYSIP